MKVKPYRICDICGREYRKDMWCLKVKVGREHIGDMWSTSIGFDRMDICATCGSKMIDYIKERRK